MSRPSVNQLSKLTPLKHLSKSVLQTLANKITIEKQNKGSKILTVGSTKEDLLFLLSGSVIIRAQDGAIRKLSHNDRSANDPIARLRPSRFDVVAVESIEFLRINPNLLSNHPSHSTDTAVVELSEDEAKHFNQQHSDIDPLLLKIEDDLNQNKLIIPSLPDVAIKVGLALKKEDSNATTMAQLIAVDPAITLKLLKVANSALYAGKAEINSLAQAIARIGMEKTHKLVIVFALRDLFRCKNKQLNRRMEALWAHSRKIAAVCQVLSNDIEYLNPDIALLSGLLHDVGVLAILAYAQTTPQIINNDLALDTTINKLRGKVSRAILESWQLPHNLGFIAEHADTWDYEHDGDADYLDTVIVAQLFSFPHDAKPENAPNVENTPAYLKLHLNDEEEDSGLVVLMDADAEIAEIEDLLGA